MRELLDRVQHAGREDARRLLGKEAQARDLSRKNRKIGAMWDDICDSFQMVGKIFSGEFTNYEWSDVAWIVGGLGYLLMPLDMIPDAIPVFGLSDDVVALGAAFVRGGKVLSAFRAFMAAGGRKMLDNLGLKASLSEAFKRLVNTQFVQSEPLPGTPLVVSLGYAVEHSGMYLGGGRVAELYDGSDGGRLRTVSVRDFLACNNLRTGDYVYAACVEEGRSVRPLEDVRAARWAQWALDQHPEIAYNMLKSNCHMFTASCLLHRLLCVEREGEESIWDKMTKNLSSVLSSVFLGTFTIETLTKVVKKELASGNDICWCPVADWSRTRLCR